MSQQAWAKEATPRVALEIFRGTQGGMEASTPATPACPPPAPLDPLAGSLPLDIVFHITFVTMPQVGLVESVFWEIT